MRLIRLFDDKNYPPDMPVFHRDAARAIILRGGRLAMVHSLKEGFYKFPGGGVEEGEDIADTVIRETEEEVGLRVVRESMREYGYITERRLGLYENGIFEMDSYYFLADVDDASAAQRLDGYEAELGYVLRWVEPKKAYEANMRIGEGDRQSKFLLREAEVLREIIENF